MSKRFSKAKIDKKQNRRIKKIENMLMAETKQHTVQSSPDLQLGGNTNQMVQTLLTDIAQGTANGQRIGDSIQVHGIRFKGYSSYAEQSANFLRIFLVRLRGLYRTISPTNLLSGYTTTDVRFANMLSDYDHDYVRVKGEPDTKDNDIEILWEKVIPYNSTLQNAPGQSQVESVKFGKRLRFKKPLQITYNGSSQANGQLVCLVMPGARTSNTLNPNYAFVSDIYYTDA